MMDRDLYRDAIYNLKAVVERTGVTADALRAWERRYGLPDPSRTAAGHRIYSERDIDVIKWLVARQGEGLRIGRAVELWRTLETEGEDPLRSMPLASAPPRPARPTGDTIEQLRDEWVAHCLAFDERAAEQVLNQALAMYPPELVFSGIIGAGISEIGHSWYLGEVTPHQEHFASELAMRRLEALIEAAPPPTRRAKIITACPPGEEHTLGMTTFTLLLRRLGWDVVYLGANVPADAMAATIEAVDPDLIVLAAQQLETASSLLDLARLGQTLEVPLAYGGRIFNEEAQLRRRIPGHFLGQTLDQAVAAAERLLTTGYPTPDVEPASDEAEALRAHFLDRLPAILSNVRTALEPADASRDLYESLSESLMGATAAALRFDDLDLLGRQIDWVAASEAQNQPSVRFLESFLVAYRQAAADHLDERGTELVEWLSERASEESRAEQDSA